MSYGAHALTVLNLEGVVEFSEVRTRLQNYAKAHPEREWVEAAGVFYEALDGLSAPVREAIDEIVPNRPVFLRSFDYHSAWCNTEALRRVGIEGGLTLPLPNEVVVDPSTKLATGLLKEREAFDAVARMIPGESEEDADEALRRAMRHVNAFGITSVQNMNGDTDSLAQHARLEKRGQLTVRSSHYLNVRPSASPDLVEEYASYHQRHVGPWNRVPGIKLFIDGVIESKTALLFEPYSDGSKDLGVPDMDPQAYREFVQIAHALEMDVATHAVGDKGVHLALDAYETAIRGGVRGATRRHRIEHIEVIQPDDMRRFESLGVTASMQPFHAAPATDPAQAVWFHLLGNAREPFAFPWQALVRNGADLAFGSDWPIVSADVRLGLLCAMTRVNANGVPAGGWQPQQSLTLAQSLDAYTSGAARAEGQGSQKGTLREGMLADVCVFDQDLFRLSPHEFPAVAVVLTIVDGQIVHRSV